MKRNVKQIIGDKLGALDGEMGHVKDFYFDDEKWTIRYLVADTGSWMPGRLVLISPHAVGELYSRGRVLLVKLTRQQIENSPSIDSHKPLSRQYEENYHRYYGWPYYWLGEGLWGMSGFPILSQRPEPFPGEKFIDPAIKGVDPHLRSAQTIAGYQAEGGGEIIGRIADFLVDDKSWAITNLVLDTGSWLHEKKVLISPSQIERISWDDSKVVIKLTKEDLQHAPAYSDDSLGATNRDSWMFQT